MKNLKMVVVSRLILILFLFVAFAARAAKEESFDVLQIGATTYKNVTITTKTKSYIVVLHNGGINTVKVADLPPELLDQLGYNDIAPKKDSQAKVWAKTTFSKVGGPRLKELQQNLGSYVPAVKDMLSGHGDFNAWLMAFSVALIVHLLWSYCASLICRKAGELPGNMIWVPILQMIPIFRAARMSGAWLLALFVPVLNIIAMVIWCFKISSARGKGPAVGVMLLLPVLNVFALLYLAFSNDFTREEKKDRRIEIMTLESA